MLIVIISICVFLILFIVSLLTWLCLRKKKGVYMGIIPKILYINLNHREDRKKNFLSNFNGYDMGKDDKIVRIEGVHEKENGALGCLKSHIKALEYANKLDFPYVLVCEDDFQFFDFAECEKHVQTFMEKVKEWDVLLIGLNLNQKEDTEHEGVIRVLNSQTCSAFLIKKEYLYTNSSKTRYITHKKNINDIEIMEIVVEMVFVGVIYKILEYICLHLFTFQTPILTT